MTMTSQKDDLALIITTDQDPINPRGELVNNLGTMVCFHKKYILGDRHDCNNTRDFLQRLCSDTVPAKDFVKALVSGEIRGLRIVPCEESLRENLEENLETGGIETKDTAKSADHISAQIPDHINDYILEVYDKEDKMWYIGEHFFSPPVKIAYSVMESALEHISDKELMRIVMQYNEIMPLYLDDRSGLSISTESFSGRATYSDFDRGLVGWIYANHEEIQKEYGDPDSNNNNPTTSLDKLLPLNPATLETIRGILKSEVELYNHYLQGNCYGFQLFKGGEEIQAIWGFYGEIEDVVCEVRDILLPDGYKDLVDSLETQSTNFNSKDFTASLRIEGLQKQLEDKDRQMEAMSRHFEAIEKQLKSQISLNRPYQQSHESLAFHESLVDISTLTPADHKKAAALHMAAATKGWPDGFGHATATLIWDDSLDGLMFGDDKGNYCGINFEVDNDLEMFRHTPGNIKGYDSQIEGKVYDKIVDLEYEIKADTKSCNYELLYAIHRDMEYLLENNSISAQRFDDWKDRMDEILLLFADRIHNLSNPEADTVQQDRGGDVYVR
jgi:hypothetical protein